MKIRVATIATIAIKIIPKMTPSTIPSVRWVVSVRISVHNNYDYTMASYQYLTHPDKYPEAYNQILLAAEFYCH